MGPLILFLLLLFPSSLFATAAADCSIAAIQAAITATDDGETVTVPAGNCTWVGSLSSTAKNLTFQGAGIGQTNITIDGSTVPVIDFGTKTVRLTGFTFTITSVSGGSYVVRFRGQNWRADHNRCVNNYNGTIPGLAFIYASGGTGVPHPTGLVDQNEFVNCRVYIQADLRLVAAEIWAQDSKIGNPDQSGVIYIENNDFERSTVTHNCADGQYGARYVFRYNRVVNSGAEVHSVQGDDRAQRSWEFYNNTFTSSGGLEPYWGLFIRAGTGVAFNNTFDAGYQQPLGIDNDRSFNNRPTSGCCDGSSPWDQNTVGEEGWRCRDQIGTGKDSSLWNPPGNYPSQAIELAYFWGNTQAGSPIDPVVNPDSIDPTCKPNGAAADIVAGRDYILSARPDYVPYVYPHPLNTDSPPPVQDIRKSRRLKFKNR